MKLLGILVLLTLSSCSNEDTVRLEQHTVIRVFKVPPVTVLDQITPIYKAVLEDSSQIPVPANTVPSQIFTYKYYTGK